MLSSVQCLKFVAKRAASRRINQRFPRALASRGEIKPDQITPLFAIDEVHRLDPKGQGMIVEFAKRENFQVFVTASSLKPSYACTLYALERIYEPEERLVIRGMEKVSKAVA